MIAIAESGSTKCEWVILDERGITVKNFKTQGYNPDFHSTEFVYKSLSLYEDMCSVKNEITHVYFYGASCSSARLNKIISDGLEQVFTNAAILVDHDLLAAAYSVYEGTPTVCCIIGTGSNSCYYDGNNTKEVIPALGFIMGDESGGAYFGKQLVSDFFYNKLPESIHKDFEETFQLSWNNARQKIYGNIHANVYLASFMPFIFKHKENSHITKMIREGIAKFISIHVKCYEDMPQCKVGFVGSIAFLFKNIVREELRKQGCEMGKVIKSPINELVNYHLKYIIPSIVKVKEPDNNTSTVLDSSNVSLG